jgi:gamma-glutamyltranspeptidase
MNIFTCIHIFITGTGMIFNNRVTGFSMSKKSPNCLAPFARPAHTLVSVYIHIHIDLYTCKQMYRYIRLFM